MQPPGTSGGTYVPPEDTFEILTALPLVRFLTQAVQPPSIVYVTNQDNLVLAAASSQAGESITISYRLLLANGQVQMGQTVMAVPSSRTVTVNMQQLAEGFLLSVSLKAAVATTRGQTFARVFLTNPSLGAGQPSYMLMADYVTTAMAPAFPNGRQLAPTEGPGWLSTQTVSNPSAGSDWALALPANVRWRIAGITAQLNTSAVAGNRYALLRIDSGGITIALTPCPVALVASTSYTFTWAVGIQASSDGSNHIAAPVGDAAIRFGLAVVRVVTVGIQSGDQWSAISVGVEEWLDNV